MKSKKPGMLSPRTTLRAISSALMLIGLIAGSVCISLTPSFAQDGTPDGNGAEPGSDGGDTDAGQDDGSTPESPPPLVPGLNPEYAEQTLLQDYNGNGVLEVTAFGDSIVRGAGDFIAAGEEVNAVSSPDPREAGFPLRTELFLGIGVSNLGDPGERLSRAGVYRFAAQIPATRPDLVLIQGGANDAIDRISGEEYFRAVQTMINISQALGVSPVLITIPPQCCEHLSLVLTTRNYNDLLQALAAINGVPLADSYKGFANTCSVPECYLLNLPEGLHPNTEGYDVMGEVVVATLLNIDLFAAEGPGEFELALNLPAGSVTTVPDELPEPPAETPADSGDSQTAGDSTEPTTEN